MATLTKSLLPISGYTDQYYTYQCVVTENSYDIANNTSNVTITFSVKGPWAPSFYEWKTNYGIIVDGVAKKTGSSSPYISTSYVQLLTWTGNVSHSSDGSKKINVGVYLHHSGPSSYLPKQYTSSSPLSMGSVTLTTIPRASSITSVGNVTLGNACSVRWTPASSSFKYKLKFSLGTWSYTTGYISPSTTSAYTYTGYTIPNTSALLDDIPDRTTEAMTATLYTYNSGGTQIGSTSSKTFTVTVPSTVQPTVGTITLNPADINSQNILVQGKNKLTISVSGCSAGTGSGIKSYTFSGPGISSTTTSTSVTSGGTISNTGTLTYTVTVTDNRGRIASKTATIVCHAWSAPSITFDAYRVASRTSTTEDDNGTYVRCVYDLAYSSVSSTNDVTVTIYYKKNSASSWSSETVLTDSTNISGSYTLSGIDAGSTYTVYATIMDNYGGSTPSAQVTIFGASRALNITKDGTGVAFGKLAENTKLFESRYKIKSPGIASRRGTRPIDANTSYETEGEEDYLGTMEHYLSSNQMTANKPTSGNGHIIHCHWDVAGTAGDSQLFLHASTGEMQSRGCSEGAWNSWRTSLDSVNYTSYVSQKPISLYSTTTGTVGAITLSQSAANFTYLEIFYTDNNGRQPQSVRIYSPNGKYVSLSCIEPSTSSSDSRVYIRSSGWTISGTSMTVGRSDLDGANRGVYGQIYPHANGTNIDVKVTANNYIKIFRVLGYK